MKPNEYLQKILAGQIITSESVEAKALDAHEAIVKKLISDAFPDDNPVIRRGGSFAKGTAILESYDLDVPVYFTKDTPTGGKSLKDIYEAVESALGGSYIIERKTSAIRLHGTGNDAPDFHVDLVPGRFIEGNEGDVFLHRTDDPERDWMQTNLDTHIKHIKESKRQPVIRLLKLWRKRTGQNQLRTFILELLAIKALQGRGTDDLSSQLKSFWQYVIDHEKSLSVEDPANSNNNLAGAVDVARMGLVSQSKLATASIEDESLGWESVFGTPPEDAKSNENVAYVAALASVASSSPHKPWSTD